MLLVGTCKFDTFTEVTTASNEYDFFWVSGLVSRNGNLLSSNRPWLLNPYSSIGKT